MRSLLTALLLLLSTLAHAGNGDFIKATVNGKPYNLIGDDLLVYHDADGSDGSALTPNQIYQLTPVGFLSKSRMELTFQLPVGGALKTGPYPLPDPLEFFNAKPPYVALTITEGEGADVNVWSLNDGADGQVVITSIQGKVVEGTFRGKLRNLDDSIREVTNGTFRFTME